MFVSKREFNRIKDLLISRIDSFRNNIIILQQKDRFLNKIIKELGYEICTACNGIGNVEIRQIGSSWSKHIKCNNCEGRGYLKIKGDKK